MRPAIVLSALILSLASAPAFVGCGGSARAALRVGAMPAGGSFTGVWFSPEYGEMHIEQNGAAAIGRYEKDERHGRLQGSVDGDIMRFEWTESRELIVGRPTKTRGHGFFRITHSEADDTWNVAGEWGNDDAETGGGPWTAVKSKTRQPNVSSDTAAAPTSGGDREGGSSYGGQDVPVKNNELGGI